MDNGRENHYNYDFIFIDDEIVNDEIGADATILIYLELFSPDTSSFQTGTFNFIDGDVATQNDIDGQYFFFSANVALDNDGVIDDELDGPAYDMTGGSVTVSGSDTTSYTVVFNITSSGGRTLTGTYTAGFVVGIGD